ncbi:MAG: Rab family GTPase [Candidatus Thorarchaeota archaeon]
MVKVFEGGEPLKIEQVEELNIDEIILKICSIGDYQVGKTSLIHRYAENVFSEDYLPTLGVDITTKRIIVDDTPIKLILMDTAGQEQFGRIRRSYFLGCAGCLIVYDVTRRDSFESLERWVREFRSGQQRENKPIAIIGNKNDLKQERQVGRQEGESFAKVMANVSFYECSAKLGGPEIPRIYENISRQYLKSVQSGRNRGDKEPTMVTR